VPSSGYKTARTLVAAASNAATRAKELSKTPELLQVQIPQPKITKATFLLDRSGDSGGGQEKRDNNLELHFDKERLRLDMNSRNE
jgi:hypothetical protein